MNTIKAQREVFDAINKGNRVCAFKVGDDKLFVTPDGYMGYVFPLHMVNFSVDKVSMLEKPLFPLAECVQEENELKITQEFRSEFAFGKRAGRMFRKLEAPGKAVYVNDVFLRNFQAPRLWQEKEEDLKRIVVTEGRDNVPVGVILPVRVYSGRL